MKATVVKVTGRSAGKDGISKELNYIGDGTTPAHDITILPKSEQHQRLYRQRNIMLGGVGVDTTHGIKGVKADFQRLAHKKPGVKVKTTNLVIAPQPGTVNPHDYEQVSRFRDFCERYAKAVFPHHLAYIAIQMDNGKRYVPDEWTPGKLHAHVIVSNLSTRPPYKAMRGNDYGILRLRRLYDQQALIFNHRQNAIHLGPSEINDGSVHLTQYEKLLTRKLQPVLDKADRGAYHTRTDFKSACRAQGVKLRFSSFKHRKYVVKTNSNGKHYKRYIYRRYRQGKKKGRLMYRKTKRGRHKIPVYTHTYGVSFWLPKAQHNHKLTRIRGSKLGKYDGRLNYKHINFDIQHAHDIREAQAEERHNDTEPIQQQKPTDFADYYAKDSADMGWAAMASADNVPANTSYASSAYSSEISVASTAVRTHGVDLASMTPKPLSSASYSPEVEIALASVGASVSSANGTTLSNINNFENAFGADTDEMAIARENRIAERNEARRKHEAKVKAERLKRDPLNINNLMPNLSNDTARQGVYTWLTELCPASKEFNPKSKDFKIQTGYANEAFSINHHDVKLIKGFIHNMSIKAHQIYKDVDQRFYEFNKMLARKAKEVKTWLAQYNLARIHVGNKAQPINIYNAAKHKEHVLQSRIPKNQWAPYHDAIEDRAIHWQNKESHMNYKYGVGQSLQTLAISLHTYKSDVSISKSHVIMKRNAGVLHSSSEVKRKFMNRKNQEMNNNLKPKQPTNHIHRGGPTLG